MTGNRLTTLLPGNFSVYPELQILVLDDNLLTRIPAEGLDSLPQLTNLWVYSNGLHFTACVATVHTLYTFACTLYTCTH